MDFEPTMLSATKADVAGKLIEWCCWFLDGPGNNEKLARHIRERAYSAEMRMTCLSDLVRIMGPEPGMRFTEQMERWDSRVSALMQAIRDHVDVPPIIVTDFWDEWHISDGCHRHEAYRRLQFTHHWVIYLSKSR